MNFKMIAKTPDVYLIGPVEADPIDPWIKGVIYNRSSGEKKVVLIAAALKFNPYFEEMESQPEMAAKLMNGISSDAIAELKKSVEESE